MNKLEISVRQLKFAKGILGFKSSSVSFLFQHRLKPYVTRRVVLSIFFYILRFLFIIQKSNSVCVDMAASAPFPS